MNGFDGSILRSKPARLSVLAVGALTLALSLPVDAAGNGNSGYTFSVLGMLGTPAPGGGYHYGDFEPQDINASGTATVVSDLLDDDLNFAGEGLFIRRSGVTTQIVRTGMPAPGTSANYGMFGSLSPTALNDAGNVAFGFTLDVPFDEFGTNAGVWRYRRSTGSVTPVLVPGQPAPGGTTFRGSLFHTDMNNGDTIATVGIIDTTEGNCTDSNATCYGLGRGVYSFDRFDVATKIAAPGDPVPGGGKFDDAWDPNINDRGDIVFGGHVKGEPCNGPGNGPSTLGCYESLYLYVASSRAIVSVVHQGDPMPGLGDTFYAAFNGRLNNVGDMSFIGAATSNNRTGVFVRTHGGTLFPVALPGVTPLPGGTMANATYNQGSHTINNSGIVAFAAQLDADANGDGIQDTGVYVYERGTIRAVVRTGMNLPGIGTVAHVNNNYFVGSDYPDPMLQMNERGQVLTQVITETGDTYLVVATPD